MTFGQANRLCAQDSFCHVPHTGSRILWHAKYKEPLNLITIDIFLSNLHNLLQELLSKTGKKQFSSFLDHLKLFIYV